MANFLDTFDGTGTLAAHTSDSGQTYGNISGGYNTADMLLDGAGALYGVSDNYGGAIPSPDFIVPAFRTMSIVIEVGTFTGSDYANFTLDMADGYGSTIQARQYGGVTEVVFGAGYGWQTVTPGVHTYVETRYDGGRAVYIDGVGGSGFSQGAYNPGTPLKFYLEMTGGSLFKVRSLSITEPTAPSNFWTANVGTTEVFE